MLPPYSEWLPRAWDGPRCGFRNLRRPGCAEGAFWAAAGFNRMVGTLLTQATVEFEHRPQSLGARSPATRRVSGMTIKASRRFFLSGAGALAAAAFAGPVSAQDVIGEILKSERRGNWDDTFDARASQGDKVASNLPIFSLQTVLYIEQAIAQYSGIVAQGGWPMVPATKKLQLGVVDPDVVALRKRLMVSGDLSTSAGISRILRHLCRRRGEALPGAPRPAGRWRARQIFLCRDERIGARCGSASSRPISCGCAPCQATSAAATSWSTFRRRRSRRSRTTASCCATPRSSARSTARRRSSIRRSTRSSSIRTGTRRNRSSARTSSR